MLKKLVKYGNSTALVLEKSLLELTGMQEGGYVKISTSDGKSLTITPATNAETESKMLRGMSPLGVASKASYEKQVMDQYGAPAGVVENTDAYKAQVASMQPMFTEMFAKHNVMALMGKMMANVDYNKEVEELGKLYDPVINNAEYIKAYLAIRHKYCPEIKAYDDEVAALTAKFNEDQRSHIKAVKDELDGSVDLDGSNHEKLSE